MTLINNTLKFEALGMLQSFQILQSNGGMQVEQWEENMIWNRNQYKKWKAGKISYDELVKTHR